MEALLDVRDLTTEYATYGGKIRAIEGIDLQVFPGELLGIVGAAASGKSTLVYSILNLVPKPGRIVGGEVWFEKANLLRMPAKQLQALRGSRIGLIVSDPRRHLNPLMRVGDQIAAVIQAHQQIDQEQARKRARNLIATVGIPDPDWRMQAYPHEFSGGMCQRIGIAMAVANSPRLILADEPTSGLDVTVQVQILDLLRDEAREQGSAAVVVTRDLGIVAHYCQRVAVMAHGRIIEVARTEDFFNRARSSEGAALLRATMLARGSGAELDRRGSVTGNGRVQLRTEG
jgi:ABC-type dipeptide/oligopeptide/nickel transport system ATPase component